MGNGDGSAANPYLIEDLADFDTFADLNNAATYWSSGVHTQLMANINLSGRTYNNAVIAPAARIMNWTGGYVYSGTAFAGILEGNGYSINNLTIDTIGGSGSLLGFFGWIGFDGTVNNVSIENGFLSLGQGCTGHIGAGGSGAILAGLNQGIVNECSAHGSVYGQCATLGEEYFVYLSGFAAINEGIIKSSLADCDIHGNANAAGGFICMNDGVIQNCYSLGHLQSLFTPADGWLGGFDGVNFGTVQFCYCGGLVKDIYASSVGSFVGIQYDGLVGNCLWDQTNYEEEWLPVFDSFGIIYDSTPEIVNVGGYPREIMYQRNIYLGFGWDFVGEADNGTNDIWTICQGTNYPRLEWEILTTDIACSGGVNMFDLTYLSNYWGLTGCGSGTDCGRADIDGSGDVGIGDLAAVANDWLKE